MKKKLLLLFVMMGVLSVHADNYSYLTFETTDGTKTSVSVSGLSISISGTLLTAGSHSFTLSDLNRMYFSTSDESSATGISEISAATLDETAEIYDLRGVRVNKNQMRRGVYVVKTQNGTYKMNVK
ncbi:MAG: hypothetical protein K5764_02190 [Prevotella sp.]|nr:hypothetical protein [Prevotella sp.]